MLKPVFAKLKVNIWLTTMPLMHADDRVAHIGEKYYSCKFASPELSCLPATAVDIFVIVFLIVAFCKQHWLTAPTISSPQPCIMTIALSPSGAGPLPVCCKLRRYKLRILRRAC